MQSFIFLDLILGFVEILGKTTNTSLPKLSPEI